jgi:hypothetical protein
LIFGTKGVPFGDCVLDWSCLNWPNYAVSFLFYDFRIAVMDETSMIFKAISRLTREDGGFEARVCRLLIQQFLDAEERHGGSGEPFPIRDLAAESDDF